MAKRFFHRKRKLRLKLKKQTIYSIFSFGLLLISGLLLLSYSRNGASLVLLNELLTKQFGWTGMLFPFVMIFFSLLFLRLRFFLARLNVALGFLLCFVSLLGLSESGIVGQQLTQIVADIATNIGAKMIFSAGFVVGVIVLFDTSIDEIIQRITFVVKNIYRLFPSQFLSFFKTKQPLVVKEKQLAIKGGQKDGMQSLGKEPMVQPTRKEGIISDTLVTNMIAGTGIWEYPPLSLLSDGPGQKADRGDVKKTAAIIEKTLESFGIEARVSEANYGPAVTQYALEIALGTKVSKITSLANDLALATEAPTGQIRIEAPIPGRSLVGIEIPNRSREIVTLKTMLASQTMAKNKSKLTVALGLDVSGSPVVSDIAKMPHVLIAGTTGSGKSVLINTVISSLLFRASPAEVKLILIDPKRVEFTSFNGIPHLLTPVIVEVEKILSSLKWAMNEMDRRYKLFAQRSVRNIDSYNELSGFQALPYIVIIIDELADLMMFAPVEVEDAIARLAQMARATGIHLVVATQRPSVNVITGLIKANIPCRIAFNVSSMIDSRVIIDMPGAEKLLGRGDMLYIPPEQAKPTRIQGAYVSERDIQKLAEYLKVKSPHVEYTEEVVTQPIVMKRGSTVVSADGHDALFEEAIRVVCQYDRASASLLQRKLQVGYARAARILDQLEEVGIVGPGEGAKPRDVLMRNAEEVLVSLQQQQH